MAIFDFNQELILEDQRVLLRPLLQSDEQFLLCFSEEEPEIWQWNRGGAAGAANLKRYVETACHARERNEQYAFIVFDKQKKRYAGSTRYYNIFSDHATAEIGFTWYGKDFRGSGLNTHCKYLLLEYLFDVLGFERAGFRANTKNERSIRAMRSIGCREEGVLRSFYKNENGERMDAIVLSILREEWNTGIKSMLTQRIHHEDRT